MAATETKPRTPAQIGKAYFKAIADRDIDLAVSLWKPGSKDVIHGIADMTAPGDIKTFFTGMWSAMPDWKFDILELSSSGKNVACRWRTTATFTGPGRFQGLAPTGSKLVIEGCDMLRVEDGEIVENNAYMNGALMAQQLGLLPAQGSFGDRAFTTAFNAKTAAANALQKLRDR